MSEEPSESSKSAEFDLKSDWVFQSQGSDRAQRCESLQRGDWQVCLALKWRIEDIFAVRKVTWLVFYGMSFLWSQLISPNRASSNYRILMRMKLRGSRRSLSAEGSGVFQHTITSLGFWITFSYAKRFDQREHDVQRSSSLFANFEGVLEGLTVLWIHRGLLFWQGKPRSLMTGRGQGYNASVSVCVRSHF